MAKGFKRTALCSAVIALSYSHSALSRGLLSFDTPYGLRATGQGFLTSSQEGSAYLDGLLPVGGDENRLFFVDGLFMQGRSKQQVSSLALGLRQHQTTMFGDALVGGYIAGDYLKTLKGRNAWVINPGLEILTVNREARLNVYAPLGKRDKTWGSSMASELPQDVIDDSGLPGSDLVRAHENTFTDTPVALLEEFPTGLELEVGQKITHGAWLRAGAYYFTYKGAKHTEGLQANLDIPLQTRGAHLLFMDSIDNRRNNLFSVGIRFDVGDTGENRAGITKRMTDPLRRHLASVQVGSAVPVRLGYKANGPSETIEDVFFFREGGEDLTPFAPGLTDYGFCTAENPCLLTNDNISEIENRLETSGFDFANNTIHYAVANGAYNTNVITFNGTETREGSSEVWGFDSDAFTHQATGDDRPLINGTLFWGNEVLNADGSVGTIKGLRINSDNASTDEVNFTQSGWNFTAQVGAGATGSISITNSDISVNHENGMSVGVLGGQSFSNNTMVTDSAITVTGSDLALGVTNLGILEMRNSNITVSAGEDGQAIGVLPALGGVISDTNIRVTAEGSEGIAYGVLGVGAIVLQKSNISVMAGEKAIGAQISAGFTRIYDSRIVASATGDGANSAAGVFLPTGLGGESTIQNSIISASATGGTTNQSFGVHGAANDTVNLINSEIDVVGDDTIATAITKNVNVATNTGNTCIRNGVVVDCA